MLLKLPYYYFENYIYFVYKALFYFPLSDKK